MSDRSSSIMHLKQLFERDSCENKILHRVSIDTPSATVSASVFLFSTSDSVLQIFLVEVENASCPASSNVFTIKLDRDSQKLLKLATLLRLASLLPQVVFQLSIVLFGVECLAPRINCPHFFVNRLLLLPVSTIFFLSGLDRSIKLCFTCSRQMPARRKYNTWIVSPYQPTKWPVQLLPGLHLLPCTPQGLHKGL